MAKTVGIEQAKAPRVFVIRDGVSGNHHRFVLDKKGRLVLDEDERPQDV
jgi:hypothetical protein